MFADRSEGLNKPGGNIVLVLGKAEIELKVFFLQIQGYMPMMLISQINWKKVSPPGLSFSLTELTFTVLTYALRNATAFRLLALKTQR